MSVSRGKRFDIFKRDKFTCQYCGRTPPAVVLEVDHVVAVSNGGGDEDENLVTSCFDCNHGKSAKPMERVLAPVNLEVETRKERLDQLIAFAEQKRREIEFENDQTFIILEHWAECEGQKFENNKYNYDVRTERAVRQFLKKLPPSEVIEAVNLAFSKYLTRYNGTFRYFCAVCWRKIKGPPVATPPPQPGTEVVSFKGRA